jgi:hypothetical protein
VRKGDDLTTFIVPKVKKIRSLNLPETLGPPRPGAGHLYLYVTALTSQHTNPLGLFRILIWREDTIFLRFAFFEALYCTFNCSQYGRR